MTPEIVVIVYIGLVLIFTVLGGRREHGLDLLSAQTLFNAPAALYALGGAINYYWLDINLPQHGYLLTAEMIDGSLWLALLGMVCFNAAYLLPQPRKFAETLPLWRASGAHAKSMAYLAVIAMFLSGAVMLLGFSYVGWSEVLNNPYGSIAWTGSVHATLVHFSMFFEAASAVAIGFLFAQKRWTTCLGLTVFILLAAYSGLFFLLGRRSSLLVILLTLLILRHLLQRPVGASLVLTYAAVMAALFVIVEMGRASPVRSLESFTATLVENAEALEAWQLWIGKVLSQGDLLASLAVIREIFPYEQEWTYGITYLEAFLRLMPGFLWRGDFQSLSPLVAPNFSFHYLAEAYMNLGILGVVVVSGAFGLGLRLINDWKERARSGFVVPVVFAALAMDLTYLVRLDLGTVLKGLVYRSMFIFFVYVLSSAVIRRAWQQRETAYLKGAR